MHAPDLEVEGGKIEFTAIASREVLHKAFLEFRQVPLREGVGVYRDTRHQLPLLVGAHADAPPHAGLRSEVQARGERGGGDVGCEVLKKREYV